MAGHLFVIRGELQNVRADAYAVSGDVHSEPSKLWRELGVAGPLEGAVVLADGRRVGRARWADGTAGPWVVPVAGSKSAGFDWYAEGIRAFVRLADAALVRAEDAKPLLAVPNLGAGGGGMSRVVGEHIERMCLLLAELAEAHDVDVAFVLYERDAYEAAQMARLRRGDACWRSLGRAQIDAADRLATDAVRGRLALFLGAGVSKGAALPDWEGLLAELEAQVPDLPVGANKLDFLDRAHLLERNLPAETLTRLVAERIEGAKQYALAHALLAALPVREVVTTNYDTLFERAAQDQRQDVDVIPYDGPAGREKWLMKLHGCARRRPGDIVLTRTSFTGFDGTRSALAGLLGGLLLTRHVLFVGASLADANVLRIVDAVQRALGGHATVARSDDERGVARTLGTTLALREKEGASTAARAKLWEGVLGWEIFEDARTLTIFLDRLSASARTGVSYLLRKSYEASTAGLDELQDAIRKLQTARAGIDTPAVKALVDEFLRKFETT